MKRAVIGVGALVAILLVLSMILASSSLQSIKSKATSSAAKVRLTRTTSLASTERGVQKRHGQQPQPTKTKKASSTTAGRKQSIREQHGRKEGGATGKSAIATSADLTCHFPPRQVLQSLNDTCLSAWFFLPSRHKGRRHVGQCLVWHQDQFCLARRGNGFATLKQCQEACEKAQGKRRRHFCHRTPKFTPCSKRDRRLPYAVAPVTTNVSARSLNDHASPGQCSLLPANKCTWPKFAFTSRASCAANCRDAPQDPSCRGGAPLHDCRRRERRLPYYFDSKSGRCHLWDSMCLVHGFPNKENCESTCLSSATTKSAR